MPAHYFTYRHGQISNKKQLKGGRNDVGGLPHSLKEHSAPWQPEALGCQECGRSGGKDFRLRKLAWATNPKVCSLVTHFLQLYSTS